MTATHLTGPIIVGPILKPDGNTQVVGSNFPNAGGVVMSQSATIVQSTSISAPLTSIVIPAYSQILSIDLFSTTLFSAGSFLLIGTTSGGSELTPNVATDTLYKVVFAPDTSARSAVWSNVGPKDVRISAQPNLGGVAGVGTLVVRYVQAKNAPETP